MADLLKPKEITVTTLDRDELTFAISRLPAVQGREIVAKYPMSALPKLGDYAVNEETMLKMMGFVEAHKGDQKIRLTTRVLVDNHVPDWECLFQIERAMLAYNTSFFEKEGLSTFFGTISQTAKAWVISTLTDLLPALSKAAKPPFKN